MLLFPDVHAQIDWSRGYESLDKEFQQVVGEAELGRRYVDKLVKVWTIGGLEQWVLIHVEVQTEREAEFPRRVYVYNYRVFDRYNRPVASLVVLADDEPGWRPTEFQSRLFGCESGIRFPTVKLLDFATREAELEASTNPFSKVVLAYLKARETHSNPADRHVWKLRLVRGLYDRGFTAKDVARAVPPHRLADGVAAGIDASTRARTGSVSRGETHAIHHEHRVPRPCTRLAQGDPGSAEGAFR